MPDSVWVTIFGIRTTAQTFADALSQLTTWSADPIGRRYVCTCPVYTLMRGVDDPAVGAALRHADMVTADGMPLVWVQRHRGFPHAERVYGPDLVWGLCERTAESPLRHAFWGGLPGIPERMAAVLVKTYPGLHVAGAVSPPVRPLENQPDAAVITQLNALNADVLWVGLGSPKQDQFMALYRPYLTAPLLIGVGAAFDLIAGVRRQAPRWMQRSGLEWVFRLGQEPRRLWRRYLLYNVRFVWRLWREKP
ncbi:MAG TPA: WecB/TagA/CpsF family glycosyltransferase [Aggregatilineales bacterium]|nr:WecB/TagA/CpsF family glycosyltransferase [Anaerolineales bacterium]HRE47521.1 WecB/TagA/CpsF family glycosyltransferase [Aggregatilineales bacterium]